MPATPVGARRASRPEPRLLKPRRHARRPALAPLERRAFPATITVMNTNDTGPDSLRDAIDQANGMAGPDTIDFAPGVAGTISLSSPMPTLTFDIDLTGPGASALTVARSAAPGT